MPPQQESDRLEKGDQAIAKPPDVESSLSATLWQASELKSLRPAAAGTGDNGDIDSMLNDFHIGDYGPTELIAKGLEQTQVVDLRDDFRPSGTDVADAADRLGQTQPERWRNQGDVYKCNVFADAALREAGISPPWPGDRIPNVHGMIQQLGEHPEEWKPAFKAGAMRLQDYKQEPGDFALWDKDITGTVGGRTQHYNAQHCGILDGKGNMLYAGSTQTGGFAKDSLKDFTGTIYGEPSVIYRHVPKHLER